MCCWLRCSTHQATGPTDNTDTSTGLLTFDHTPGKNVCCWLRCSMHQATGPTDNTMALPEYNVSLINSGNRVSLRKLSLLLTQLQHASGCRFNRQYLQFHRTFCHVTQPQASRYSVGSVAARIRPLVQQIPPCHSQGRAQVSACREVLASE